MYLIMNNSCQSTGARRPDKGCKHYKSVILQCQEKQGLIKPNIIFLMKKYSECYVGSSAVLYTVPVNNRYFCMQSLRIYCDFCHMYITARGIKYYTR